METKQEGANSPTKADLEHIRQWMEIVNQLLENISEDSFRRTLNTHEKSYSYRLMKHLTKKISVEPTNETVDFLRTCRHCKKGFEHYLIFIGHYEDDYYCPHCKKLLK